MRKSAANVFVLGLVSLAASSCAAILGLDQFSEGKGTGGAGGAGGSGGTGGGPDLCGDGKKDGTETGKDCGGPCSPCADGEGCAVGPDCASKVCGGGTCITASCSDKVKNGAEADVDCGGTCPKCGPAQTCMADGDCASGKCTAGACVSTCIDTVKGGAETDVDCGGGLVTGCPACANKLGCKVASDCMSGVCDMGTCADDYVWAKSLGGGASDYSTAYGVAIDGLGNAIVVGYLNGSVDFGGGKIASAGGDDILVAKFDSTGHHVWSERFGDAQDQSAKGVAVDGAGNVFVVGKFEGVVDFGGGPLTSSGSTDAYLVKLDPLGNHLWSKRFGDAQSQAATSVAVDGMGNVIMAGHLSGSANFGGGTLTDAGGGDVFIAKFSPDAAHVWSKRFGDSLDVKSVAVDGSGTIAFTGIFDSVVDFGGGPLVSAGSDDIYVAKLDGAGNHVWSKRFGDAGSQFRSHVAIDSSGNVVLAGAFIGGIDFGGGVLQTSNVLTETGDVFVAKLGPAGDHVWSKRFGGDFDQSCEGVVVDGSGNIAVTGQFNGIVDFGGGPLTSAGRDVYVAKLAPGGEYSWSKRFGDPLQQDSFGVGAYNAKDLVVVGGFYGTIDFGGGSLTTVGGGNMFLARLHTP